MKRFLFLFFLILFIVKKYLLTNTRVFLKHLVRIQTEPFIKLSKIVAA